jgi:gluconolactonase
VIASDLDFPEGPVVLPDGSVLLVEIRAQQLTRVWPDGRKQIVAKIPGGPNGAAIGPDGQCYVCNNGGFGWVTSRGMMMPVAPGPNEYVGGSIQRVDLTSGKVETVFDRCGDHQLKGPNDLVFDRSGGLWFTDLGKRRARDMDVGGLYYIEPGMREITEQVFGILPPQRGRAVTGRENRLRRRDADGAPMGLRSFRARSDRACPDNLPRRTRSSDCRSWRL